LEGFGLEIVEQVPIPILESRSVAEQTTTHP
jgi:hypothetical protein